MSLFAEFIANDRPLIVMYKGELLAPVLFDYPESKFGGFLAVTDYRDPVNIDEIEANGWMLWPPIRYSYTTINRDYPLRQSANGLCLGFPAPPPWASSEPYCAAPDDQMQRFTSIWNTNWLGLDNQGRDVLARVIYGFRVSVIFGLLLTILSSIVGVAAGAVQGYFGGLTDLIFQRFIEIWSSVPTLFVLIIISSVLVPGFWTLLFVLLLFQWVALVGVVRAEFLRGRNFEYIKAARALGLSDTTIMWKHLLPNAMVATLTFLPFQLSGLDWRADVSRLPRPGPAAGLRFAGRASFARQEAPRSPVARPHRLLHLGDHVVASHIYRRGCARRPRSAQDVQVIQV